MLRYQEKAEEQRNPVYRPEAAREVLSRAAQLQEENGAKLSAEQLETLAAETGIAPRYVRRALAEQRLRRNSVHHPLTRPIRRVLGGIPLIYGLLLFAIAWFFPSAPGFLVSGLIFFLPPLIAFLCGAYLNSKRLGTLSGALLVGCMIGGVLAAMRIKFGPPNIGGDDFLLTLGMLATGVCSGFAGAGLRQFFHALRKPARPASNE